MRVCATLAGLALALAQEEPVYDSYHTSPAPINLKTAAAFAILTKTGISSSSGSAVITGDVGVSPISGSAITGFATVKDVEGAFASSSQVDGTMYAADYLGVTPAKMTQAVADMEAAYTEAADRTQRAGALAYAAGGEIDGMTVAGGGVYKWTADIMIYEEVFLDTDDPNDVFIFQTTGNVLFGAGAKVTLLREAQASNVFWQIAGAVEVGAAAELAGNFLAKTKVVFGNNAVLNGRILSQTAATLGDGTVITAPSA